MRKSHSTGHQRRFRGRAPEPYRVNDRIRAYQVRLVGDNVRVDLYPKEVALRMAQEQGLDLVEISSKGDVPICKILDYAKFKYDQKKKQKEIKAKAQKTILKEIRFGPNTDDHDFNFKLKHATSFLQEGAKVKAYVHFVGRSIVYKSRGEILLLKFAQALEEHAKVDQLPKLEGKRMILMLSPKNSKVHQKTTQEASNKPS